MNGKWGYINKDGELIIPCEYDQVTYNNFKDGFSYVFTGDKNTGEWFYINTRGERLFTDSYINTVYVGTEGNISYFWAPNRKSEWKIIKIFGGIPQISQNPETGQVNNIRAGLTVAQYPEYTFYNAAGDIMTVDAFIGTGCSVDLNGEKSKIVIPCDTDGDGVITGNDYIVAMKLFLEDPAALAMDECCKLAADADGDGVITGNDYIVIMKRFLKAD